VGEPNSEWHIQVREMKDSPTSQREKRTTKYKRPNIKRYDFPPNKRARTAAGIASDLAWSTPGPSRPTHISNDLSGTRTIPLSAPPPPARQRVVARHVSRVLLLHTCCKKRRYPSVEELLQLMDNYHPTIGLKYLNLLDDLLDYELADIADMYALPLGVLAEIGNMGLNTARRLRTYTKDSLLDTLRFMSSDSDGETASNPEGDLEAFKGEGKKDRVLSWLDGRIPKCEKAKDVKVETIVVSDDEEEDDMAMFMRQESHKV
jgi:hypothetical protein